MSSSCINIRAVLNESIAGRVAIKRLSEAKPNGDTLELVTAPIEAKVVWSVKNCLNDTGQTFGGRFGTSPTVANYLCREGITDRALAAIFRMIVLEGLEFPKEGISVTPDIVGEIIDICRGPWGLSGETGVSIQTIRSWAKDGIPGVSGRWPQVFAMTLPFLFEEVRDGA